MRKKRKIVSIGEKRDPLFSCHLRRARITENLFMGKRGAKRVRKGRGVERDRERERKKERRERWRKKEREQFVNVRVALLF